VTRTSSAGLPSVALSDVVGCVICPSGPRVAGPIL
jgi:hypothetical protein